MRKRIFLWSSVTGIKEMYPFLALFILIVIPSTCKGLRNNTCNVLPKNHKVEVGSDTEVVCLTSCIHVKIFWTLDNEPVAESLSTVINSSHTVLSLRNFTKHRATLQCHRADTEQVIGGTSITTYTKPSIVSCIFHYLNQAMVGSPELFTCNWKHEIDPSLKITYSLLCDSCPSQSEICNSHGTNCTSEYNLIGEKIPYFQSSSVIVKAKSKNWEASSKPYVFKPSNILKITRPNLSVTANSDHLLVEWNIMSRIQGKTYHCQVKHSKAVNEGNQEWVLNKTLESLKEKVTIEKVESCTNYTFAVRCALGNALWSDWSLEKTVLTKLNTNTRTQEFWSPTSSVERDVKLRLWRKVAEAEKNGVRKVHAMWMEIPSTCQDTFTYSIKQTPYEERRTGVNYTDTLCDHSVCDVNVNQDAHRINLKVFNSESLFVEDSVYVPAIRESLPQVTDMQTSALEGIILVSWKAPVQPVSGYMIDYTHNGRQFYWKETKHTNASLFDLLDKKPYNITVTPLLDDKTGHGTQALQICSRVGDPGNVSIIDVQAKDKSALVSWNLKSQEACSGVVINYTVFYSTQTEPPINVTVDSTNQEIFLIGLNPETQYSVYVEAIALTGTTKSSERFFKTKMFDPMLITAFGVGGGILIVLVLSLGICCAIQWKKFKEKPLPNPGLSSVALWPSTSHEQEIRRLPPFRNPSENYDSIFMEDAQTTPTSSPATGYNHNPASDQPEEYTNPAIFPEPDKQSKDQEDPVETQHASSPGESTELLFSEDSPSSPYRSQTSAETPAPRTMKPCKSAPVKQPEKTPPLTVYITLNMFEQGQGR